jgi:hypothetical protein
MRETFGLVECSVMQKAFLFRSAVLLAACGVLATTSNDAAESAPRKTAKAKQQPRIGVQRYEQGGMAGCFNPSLSGYARAAAERIGGVPCDRPSGAGQAGGDPWEGQYTGTGEMKIARAGGANYSVRIDTVRPGCGGEIEGVAPANANRLTLSVPVQAGYQQCRIVFDRSGGSLQATTSGDCYLFHGGECKFAGTHRRQQSASVAPAAPSSSHPWIVGVWVQQGGYCASGEPIVFEAGGGYRNSGGDLDGRWSLPGNALSVFYSEIDPTTGRPEGGLQHIVMQVAEVSANEIRLDQSRMRRCPANGGAEPWHPRERFTKR